jgi:leucyl-tRNA synthetase
MTGQASMTEAATNRPFRYNARLADEIEQRWQQRWDEQGTYRQPNPGEAGFDATRPKFYCLDMFPYPSGAGLHVGHPEGYTATDIICRYKRLCGYNVLHPMGWDAFGLPAEQYAIATGVHPATTTRKSIDNFRRQLKRFGFCYDWSREFGTIDEDYYKWTQWIFLQIYDAWFDEEQDKARPIGELIEMLEGGSALRSDIQETLCTFAREQRADKASKSINDLAWSDLSKAQQRAFIDSQRLAYVGEQVVNWCPKLGTALANEEVIDGRSERGGFPVLRKPLKQWMFRITAYAERLLRGLEGVDWPASTRAMQAAWIGRSEGAEVRFPIASDSDISNTLDSLCVYTTRPDTIFGATYMVVAPEHELVEQVLANPTGQTDVAALRSYVEEARNRSDVERQENKEKTGVFTGIHCINPATARHIPVWVADYVLMGYGTGAIMAVPGQDERDWAFAEAFDLPIVRTVEPPDDFDGKAYTGEGAAINSEFLNGLNIADAKAKIIDWLEDKGVGERKVNYKLRDWLFSRQRYWGEPFPIVWDEEGHHHAIGERTLPLTLPPMTDYAPEESDTPKPLLAKAHDWVKTTAGEAGVSDGLFGLPADARVTRETNTMPGWAGSCWYFLRYCDNRNSERFVGAEAERYWMGDNGVDLYIGGAEHAVLHLLYARFWHKVLFDLGHVGTDEPFRKLFHQGLITSFAFARADKSLVPVDEVQEIDETHFVERATGEPVTQTTAKMSKSLKNVVNPDDVIAEFGADTFRLYEMYIGPLEASAPWNPRDIVGLYRFLQRVWRLVVDEDTGELVLAETADETIEKQLHRTIAKVGSDIDRISLNTAIAAMIQFVNAASSAGGLTRDQTDRFVRTLSPYAPHIAEEIWSKLGNEGSVAHARWPEYDEAMLQDDEIEIPVQILGKVRSKIMVPADADKATLEKLALADSKIAALVEGKTVRKVVVVPGRMVNIVAN